MEFCGERMIQARKVSLERQGLEDSCIISDGEEMIPFGMVFLPTIRFRFLNTAYLKTFPSLAKGLAPLDVRVRAPVLPPALDLAPIHCPLMLPPVALSRASTLTDRPTCCIM